MYYILVGAKICIKWKKKDICDTLILAIFVDPSIRLIGITFCGMQCLPFFSF